MIVSRAFRDAEADWDDIEKRRIRQCDTRSAQVITGMEPQFVRPRLECVALEKRSVDATIGIRFDSL
jgi:hypothetical protein